MMDAKFIDRFPASKNISTTCLFRESSVPYNEGKFENVLKKIRSTDTNIFPCVLSWGRRDRTKSANP